MTNLAAAVEHLSEFGIDEALLGLRHILSELPDHDFRLERHGLESGIKALLVMSNRLAELGRCAGEPVAYRYDYYEDDHEQVAYSTGPYLDSWVKKKNAKVTPLFTRPPVAGLAEWLPIDLETVPKGKPVLVSGKYEGSEFWVYCVAEYYPENSLEVHEQYPGQLDNDDVEYAPAGWYREATGDDEECVELGFEPIYFQRIEKPIAKAAREFLGKVDG